MFVGTGAVQTNGNAAELVAILWDGVVPILTDSVDDCAWSAYKYARDHRDFTTNGVTWPSTDKMCKLYRKVDPIPTSKSTFFSDS